MSRTLHMTCLDCRETLWVGQMRSDNWMLYVPDSEPWATEQFVRRHVGHSVRFEDSEFVSEDMADVTDYGDD